MLCNSAKRDGFSFTLSKTQHEKKVGDKNLAALLEIYKWCDKITRVPLMSKSAPFSDIMAPGLQIGGS